MYKILVVDDESELRTQLELIAKGQEREVLTAPNDIEAIKLIKQYDFDVVVTDLRMEENEMAGLEVLKAAKEKSIHTQVIMITAYGTPEISVETMRLGAFDYLERNTPGSNTLLMVRDKIKLALEFRDAKLGKEKKHE